MDGTEFEEIEFEVEGAVATVALNRPDKLNAGTPRMVMELIAALDLIDNTDGIRAVILTGRGRAFCAGADLSGGEGTFDYAPQRTDAAAQRTAGAAQGTSNQEESGQAAAGGAGDAGRGERSAPPRDGAGLVTMRLFECLKPVIVAVNGPAVGMGVTMTLPADIRLASENARFGFVFTRRGIVPEAASSWFLPRVVGVSQAAEWMYSGRVFDADEALAGGLVRSIHSPEALLDDARALAEEFAEAAPLSVALTRQMLWRGLTESHPMEAHRADSRAVFELGRTADAREGVMSFLEKRDATFSGSASTELPEVFPEWIDPDYH